VDKKAFKAEHGFWPHEELCDECNEARMAHTVWAKGYRKHEFVPTGRPHWD